jgi:hypothetical protein
MEGEDVSEAACDEGADDGFWKSLRTSTFIFEEAEVDAAGVAERDEDDEAAGTAVGREETEGFPFA